MIKSVLNIVFLLLIVFSSKTQENLVPNGSFEEYNWCPYQDQLNGVDGFHIGACKYWNMPTLGTSDYFNSCSVQTDLSFGNYLFSVPENYIGYQYARTGNAYAGFVFGQSEEDSPTYSEYIQIKLKSQLEVGQFYHLRFYVNSSNLVNGQSICSNSIGALFTTNELNLNNDEIIPLEPQFQSDLTVFFCDTTKWFELNHTFQAMGNENYLTIGVFTSMPITQMIDYDGNLLSGVSVYYYIDDVSLVKIDYMSLIEGKIPNVFTPNEDGINDYFMFDNALVQAKNLTILNRWGTIVYESTIDFMWDGTHNGGKCPEGVYYYIIEGGDNFKVNGFLTLVR